MQSRDFWFTDPTKWLVDGVCICSRLGSRLLKYPAVVPQVPEILITLESPFERVPSKRSRERIVAYGHRFVEGGTSHILPASTAG
ncbi:MAG TPA: hypothetical protein VMF65_18525 [Acidimicrobiales bacterium]|nr:hypothetical protein [Acidimicrobiales bacterium]